MPRAEKEKDVMKDMLCDLEQAIKDFMRVAKEKGLSKTEIDAFLQRECNTTVDEVLRSKTIH
jgi:DNA-binding phage protein